MKKTLNNKEKDNFIEEILRKKRVCIFISPHFDDAVLSCGNLIDVIAKKNRVEVINIFTKADTNSNSRSAMKFLKASGYTDANVFFDQREKEDLGIFTGIGIKTYNLGYRDSLWRKKESKNAIVKFIYRYIPFIGNIYPTFKRNVMSGNINKKDYKNCRKIKKDITNILTSKPGNITFFPAAIGGHVDHVILKKIGLGFGDSVIFYADYPYRLTSWLNKFDPLVKYKPIKYKGNGKKLSLIKKYKTQHRVLFPYGIPEDVDDIYFMSN